MLDDIAQTVSGFELEKEFNMAFTTKKTDTKLPKKKKEIGGADGPEPTRFGDWEKKGITSDF